MISLSDIHRLHDLLTGPPDVLEAAQLDYAKKRGKVNADLEYGFLTGSLVMSISRMRAEAQFLHELIDDDDDTGEESVDHTADTFRSYRHLEDEETGRCGECDLPMDGLITETQLLCPALLVGAVVDLRGRQRALPFVPRSPATEE